jgi:imidazolonepropionase-like amidohydrolase
MDAKRVLSHQTVLVQNGWIVALGPAKQVRVPVKARRIDGRGKYLLFGLADMHTHLGMFLNNEISDESEMFRWLSYGVTTLRNMDVSINMQQERVLRMRARVASGDMPGPRIYEAAPGFQGEAKNADSLVADYAKTGYDFIKIDYPPRLSAFSKLCIPRRLFDRSLI